MPLLARDLSVSSRLSIVFRLLLVWEPDAVFSAGAVVDQLKLGILLLWIFRKFLLVPLILAFISLSLT